MSADLIQAAPVERDSVGEWIHPELPEFEEGDGEKWRAWLAAQGLVTVRRMLEGEDDNHPAYMSYFNHGGADFSAWVDESPSGDGWFTLGIYDTEDGPTWTWARRVAA